MSKVVENGELVEQVQNKCKVCGLGIIEHDFDICEFCGWEADAVQNDEPNFAGGANDMSLNQYKQFWEKNKDDILKNHQNDLCYVFDKADDFYKENFEKINLDYYRSKDPDYDAKMQRAEENRRKRDLERQQQKEEKDNNKKKRKTTMMKKAIMNLKNRINSDNTI